MTLNWKEMQRPNKRHLLSCSITKCCLHILQDYEGRVGHIRNLLQWTRSADPYKGRRGKWKSKICFPMYFLLEILWQVFWRHCWETVPPCMKVTSVRLPRSVPRQSWAKEVPVADLCWGSVDASPTLPPSFRTSILCSFVQELSLAPLCTLPSHWWDSYIGAECSVVCQEAGRAECWFRGSRTREASNNFQLIYMKSDHSKHQVINSTHDISVPFWHG